MQNFLIDWHGTNHKDKCDEEGDNVAESCRNYYKEKKAQRLRTRLAGVLMVAATVLLIFSAGVGVQNLNEYGKLQEAGKTYGDVMLSNGEEEKVETVIQIAATEENLVEDTDVEAERMLEKEPEFREEVVSEEVVVEKPVMEEVVSEEVDVEKPDMEETIFEETISVETEVQEQYITYEVCKGDTLYGICVQFYGDLSKVQEICRLNNIENIDNILYGEKILLPQ